MTTLTAIYGDGRGKTSSAIGHIYRKLTAEMNVLVSQFLKTGNNCGECKFFETYTNVTWLCFGKEEFYHIEKKEEFLEVIEEGIKQLKEIVMHKQIDILVLDEIGMALFFNLISWEKVESIFHFIKDEIIITGRKIPEDVLQKVDISVNISEIKHPYNSGIQARKGIDF
ncbi:MAG: cob(I)yrinic acid a,c-diamide adenosyltransferase [Candidatus Heimdallarchaeota archaeon]|nr:cob(I)yrinic acid a,c-diamide adenosyltransferase [Candidatus Heimdallarchaeota archaeon]